MGLRVCDRLALRLTIAASKRWIEIWTNLSLRTLQEVHIPFHFSPNAQTSTPFSRSRRNARRCALNASSQVHGCTLISRVSFGSGLRPLIILSSNWPTRPRASTWSSCFPAGKESSSDRKLSYHGARVETYKPSSAMRPLIDWARTLLSPRVGNLSLKRKRDDQSGVYRETVRHRFRFALAPPPSQSAANASPDRRMPRPKYRESIACATNRRGTFCFQDRGPQRHARCSLHRLRSRHNPTHRKKRIWALGGSLSHGLGHSALK